MSSDKDVGGSNQLKRNYDWGDAFGICPECGREMGKNSDLCADCLGDRDDNETLAAFGGGLSAE